MSPDRGPARARVSALFNYRYMIVVGSVVFVRVERRAADPVLPVR